MPIQICTRILPTTPAAPAHRCGSPALRAESFCYYHHPTRKPSTNARVRQGFDLPTPTDAASLQRALGEVITRLDANRIDARRAGILLYSLQLASRSIHG